MVALWTALFVILAVCVLVAHLVGHVMALRRYGIAVEVGLGFPIGPRRVFRPRWAPFALGISLALFGVYVRPERPEEVEKLRYLDYAWYAGAGATVNVVIGLLWVIAAWFSTGDWLAADIAVVVTAAIFIWPRQFCAYVVPVLGVVITAGLLIYTMAAIGQVQGPVAVRFPVSRSPMDALMRATEMSIALGLFNMLPFYPLDGGKLVGRLLQAVGRPRVTRSFLGAQAGFAVSIVYATLQAVYSLIF
jgi:membrane-associated protease RseP (regulator of RpoE activity)